MRALLRLLDEVLPVFDGLLGVVERLLPAEVLVFAVTMGVGGIAAWREDARRKADREAGRARALERQAEQQTVSFERIRWGWRCPRALTLSPAGLVVRGRKETRAVDWERVVRWSHQHGIWVVKDASTTLRFALGGYGDDDRREIGGHLLLRLPPEAEDTLGNRFRRLLRIVPVEGQGRLADLAPHPDYLEADPESLVHLDRPGEWRP